MFSVHAVFSLYYIYCLKFSSCAWVCRLLCSLCVCLDALHGATVETIQLNRHLRHWFSVFFSMNARIEYMFLVEYGFMLRTTQRSLAQQEDALMLMTVPMTTISKPSVAAHVFIDLQLFSWLVHSFVCFFIRPCLCVCEFMCMSANRCEQKNIWLNERWPKTRKMSRLSSTILKMFLDVALA